MKVWEFFSQKKYANPDTLNVAGYLVEGKFYYLESTNKALPAAVQFLQSTPREKHIYTNLRTDHWLRTYLRQVHDHNQSKRSTGSQRTTKEAEFAPVVASAFPAYLEPPDLPAPLTGGLYQAAWDLKSGAERADAASRTRGLRRILRYYMLTTYSLLDMCRFASYEGLGNYVAALLVSDKGEILSAGVNTGSYRHAEVSMLHAYFHSNPTATTYPENTIVFSTLTPCKQCTGYLKDTKPVESVIYFGQEDPGKFGSVGKEISFQLASVTDAPTVYVSVEDAAGAGLTVPTGADGVYKAGIAAGLASCVSGNIMLRNRSAARTGRGC